MQRFTTVELLRDIKTVTMAVDRQPVAITKHRKPKFVLMSMDQYQQLAKGATQQVHMLDEMPDELKALMIEGLERDMNQDAE